MTRLRFVSGAFEMIIGFFVYEYGLFLTLNLWPTLSDWTLSVLPWTGPIPATGAVLQLIGGVLSIAGLLSSIASLGSQPRAMSKLGETQQISEPAVQPALAARRCKFCGTAMDHDAVFCPKCERAQT